MPLVDFQTAVKQEEEYLRKVYPMTEDIPGCMSLLDGFLICNGTSRFLYFRLDKLTSYLHTQFCTHKSSHCTDTGACLNVATNSKTSSFA